MIPVYHSRLGMVDSHVVMLDAFATEYDERLFLDRHPDTGDWVVYIKMERPSPPFPVMGLGKTLPSRDEFQKKLVEQDAQRNDIRKQVNDANKKRDAELDHATQEKVGAAAELADFIVRKTSGMPETKSYRKVKKG